MFAKFFKEDVPECSPRAIILSLILTIVLCAANTYLGLYAGMTVSASIPAAVISMGIFRGILRKGTILENNIVQTAASTGESVAAGAIFTMPALMISGVWQTYNFWVVTLVTMLGGVLGIIFMIPMREALIVRATHLTYPEGVACAEVLRAGDSSGRGLTTVLLGSLAGGVLKFFTNFFGLFKGTVEGAFRAGHSVYYWGTDISAALVAVGYIVGPYISFLLFLGGALGWLVGVPIFGYLYPDNSMEPLDYDLDGDQDLFVSHQLA